MPRKPKSPSPNPSIAPVAGKCYRGRRIDGRVEVVLVENGVERPLDPRLDLRRHAGEFEWGYAGGGPAQLALALAADVLGDDEQAREVYQKLKFGLIGGLGRDTWELSEEQVRAGITAGLASRPPANPVNVAAPPEPPPAETIQPGGPRAVNPFGYKQDVAAGVRLLEDRRFKQLQLKFREKPSAAVRAAVAEAGWKWRDQELAWTRQIDPTAGWQTRADAERLFDRVTAMIREELGLSREPS